MDLYVYLDINDPTNVIKIDHPKNNGKVHLLFSNNCHYDALVSYNDEEEEEKDQQDTDQEYISANFSMKVVSLKASKKIRRKTNTECKIEKTKQLFSTNSNKNNRFPFFKYADRGEARYFEEVFEFFKSGLTKFPSYVYDQKEIDRLYKARLDFSIKKLKEEAKQKAIKFVGLEEIEIDYKQTYDSILNVIIED